MNSKAVYSLVISVTQSQRQENFSSGFFKLLIFIHLAVLGLSCGAWDP